MDLRGYMLLLIAEFVAVSTTLVVDATFPPLSPIEVEGATVWKCYSNSGTGRKEDFRGIFSDPGTELLHSSEKWLTILSSSLNKERLKKSNLHPCFLLSNISRLLDKEREQHFDPSRRSLSAGFYDGVASGKDGARVLRSVQDLDVNSGSLAYGFDHYKNYSALMAWYQALVKGHSSVVKMASIGRSYYHREIPALHFTSGAGGPRRRSASAGEKPVVYLQCLLHAREWISGAVCMYIAKHLAEGSQILEEVDVVIVPVANPDGYYLTWYGYPKYRLWRKNVEPFPGTKCAGVDLNRNFDAHWNENLDHYAENKCSSIHHGPAPGSTHEVRAITRFIASLGRRVVGFMDIHSFLQKVLYPPAWRDANPEDIGVLQSVAKAVADAMSEVGVAYSHMRMVDIYSASGTFPDWLLDYRESSQSCQSLIPMTVELRPSAKELKRDSINMGFMLPTEQILPTCTEMLAGFEEFVKQVLNSGRSCYSSKSN